MLTVSDRELRDRFNELLSRAEAGETFAVEVAGRPVAHLGPIGPARWVSGSRLQPVWSRPAPGSLGDDLALF